MFPCRRATLSNSRKRAAGVWSIPTSTLESAAAKTSARSSTASWPTLISAALMLWSCGALTASPVPCPICSGRLETFNALGIAFVSLSEQMDTTTPDRQDDFHGSGAVAELERSLIVERVRAGLRNARAKGKRLGRPSKAVDGAVVTRLRSQGVTWRAIARQLGVGVGTLYRVAPGCSKTPV